MYRCFSYKMLQKKGCFPSLCHRRAISPVFPSSSSMAISGNIGDGTPTFGPHWILGVWGSQGLQTKIWCVWVITASSGGRLHSYPGWGFLSVPLSNWETPKDGLTHLPVQYLLVLTLTGVAPKNSSDASSKQQSQMPRLCREPSKVP